MEKEEYLAQLIAEGRAVDLNAELTIAASAMIGQPTNPGA